MAAALKKEALEAKIARAEEDLLELELELREEDTATAEHAQSQPLDITAADPRQYLLEFLQQQQQWGAEAEQLLRAEVGAAEQAAAELTQHIQAVRRVVEQAERSQDDSVAAVLQRIERVRRRRQRLMRHLKHVLSKVLHSVVNDPDHMTMQSLLNALYKRMMQHPSDPYLSVSADMWPEHLATLEAVGIVSFRRSETERHVRLRDLGPVAEDLRLPEQMTPEELEAFLSENAKDK